MPRAASPYGRAWPKVRLAVLARDGWRCRIESPVCTGRATEVDHIVRLADGGDWWDPANLRAACQPCNLWREQHRPKPDPEPSRIW